MSNSKKFKCIIVNVTDEDINIAKRHLYNHGQKPTYRNASSKLKEWARSGLDWKQAESKKGYI